MSYDFNKSDVYLKYELEGATVEYNTCSNVIYTSEYIGDMWGKGVSENNIGWGQGYNNNSIHWAWIYPESPSGETELYIDNNLDEGEYYLVDESLNILNDGTNDLTITYG